MDPKAMRERLLRERADLEGTVTRIRERLAVPQRDSGGTSPSPTSIPLTRRARPKRASSTSRGALGRLDRGEYGRCVICGRAIPDERLELVPETPYCVEDAEREQQSSTR